MKIQIFVTGGTFDKDYDEIQEELIFKHTHLQDMIERGRAHINVIIETLMLIDSLDMTKEQRSIIVESCKKTDSEHIVITHGTSTMELTAKKLGEEKISDKTIVLTGAMQPYAFGSSDGMFNLGCALAFSQSLAPGVYVAMNGRYFEWDKVHKNTQSGFFEDIS